MQRPRCPAVRGHPSGPGAPDGPEGCSLARWTATPVFSACVPPPPALRCTGHCMCVHAGESCQHVGSFPVYLGTTHTCVVRFTCLMFSMCRCAEIRHLWGPCTYPPSHVRVQGLQWHRRFSEGPAVAGTALPACGDDFCPPARYFYPPPLSVCNGQVQAGVRLRASVWRPRSLAEGRCDGVPSPEQPPTPQAVGRRTTGEPAHPDPPA